MPQEPSPQIPNNSYRALLVTDKLVVDLWNTESGDYKELEAGSRHPIANKYPGYFLIRTQATESEKWVQRMWVKDLNAQNTFNLQRQEFDAESNAAPVYFRRYEVRRNEYAVATKGTALTAVVSAKVTATGSGYTSEPTVTPSGGGGSGATFRALIFRGEVVWIVVTAEGTGYSSAPTLGFSGGNGTGAAATAAIQPSSAVLVREFVERVEGQPTDSVFVNVVRVYKTLPGGTVTTRTVAKTGFNLVRTEQTVAAATLPTGGNLVTRDQVAGDTSVEAKRVIETITNADGTAASAHPIFEFEEIDWKNRVVRIRKEQKQPASTATTPILDAQDGTSKVLAPNTLNSITVVEQGSGFTGIPTITPEAPTGTPSTQATATAHALALTATIDPAFPGTGYAIGDVVTGSGYTGTPPQFTLGGLGLVSTDVNAGGSGVNINDFIALSGGTPLTATIVEIAIGAPGIFRTSAAHGLTTGMKVRISGSDSTPTADGVREITYRNDYEFTVTGLDITVAGTTGTVTKCAIVQVSSGVPASATVDDPGTGTEPGDGLLLVGGTHAGGASTFTIATTKVVSATIAAGGSGGSDGTQTVTGTTGTGTKFTASVTVSGGAITAVLSILTGGSYTVNPTTPSAEPVTGASLSGAQLNVVLGANTVTVGSPTSYSEFPTNPAATTGAPSGVTLNVSWAAEIVTVPHPGSYSVGATTFTQGATSGTGTGTTFNNGLFGGSILSVLVAGDVTATPGQPVAVTGGSGTGMKVFVTYGLLSVTMTNQGAGYFQPNPKVTVSGSGGTGAKALGVSGAYGWRSANAYIIDGGVEDIEGTTLKRVWWLVAPVPPLRKDYPTTEFVFPGTFTPINGAYNSPFVARLGINYRQESARPSQVCGLLVIESQIGPWTDLKAGWIAPNSPGTASNYFQIPRGTIHPAFTVSIDGVLVETVPASTPSSYSPSQNILVVEYQKNLWGNVWQKHSLWVTETGEAQTASSKEVWLRK